MVIFHFATLAKPEASGEVAKVMVKPLQHLWQLLKTCLVKKVPTKVCIKYTYLRFRINISIYLSIHRSIYIYLYLSTSISIYLSVHPSIHPSIDLCIHQFICIYTFISIQKYPSNITPQTNDKDLRLPKQKACCVAKERPHHDTLKPPRRSQTRSMVYRPL